MTRPSFGLMRSAQRAGKRRFDVVFYTPSVGGTISCAESLPGAGAETQVLMLAEELAALGARVAIIAFGGPAELPDDVDGVSIVPRPHHGKHGGPIGNLVETMQIWRSLWRAPSGRVPALALTCDPGGVVMKHGLGAVANGSRARFAELARELWQSRGDQDALSLRCRRYIADHHLPTELARQWWDVLALSPVGHDSSPATEAQTRCAG